MPHSQRLVRESRSSIRSTSSPVVGLYHAFNPFELLKLLLVGGQELLLPTCTLHSRAGQFGTSAHTVSELGLSVRCDKDYILEG